MRRLLDTLRRVARAVITAVQRVLVAVSLFVVYFLGLGITRVLAAVFDRRLIRGTPAGQDSYWLSADGYQPDLEDARRQS